MDRRVSVLAGAAALLAVIVLVVVVAGGGSDDDGTAVAEAGDKPEVVVPDGPAPEQLQVEDLEPGEGPEAKPGDTLTVNYVGVLYENGEEFDTSWGKQPFDLQLGAGGVIAGWDQGLEGMQAGARRQLVIPPDLAYGAQGFPPDVPPDAPLVFVVDLLEIS